MASLFRAVDPEDFASVRFDCDDGTNCTLLEGFKLGTARRTSEILSSGNRDGDLEASGRYGRKQMLLPFKLEADSADGVRDIARSLGTELRRGGVFEVQLEDATATHFIEFYPCDVPELYDSELPSFHVDQGADGTYTAKVIVEPWRHPLDRLETETGTPSALDNASGNGALFVNNPGNAPGETIVSIDPSANMGGFILGIRDKGNLTEFAALYSRDATTFTDLDSNTSLTTVGSQDAVVTDFDDGTFTRRFRDERAVTDPTAAEGTHRAVLTYQATGGTTDNESKFRIQARYAFADTEILQNVLERGELDWRDVSTDSKTYWDLGLIDVPANTDTIIIDVWAKRLSGDHDLACFKIDLIPADHYFTNSSTFRRGEWGRVLWEPDELSGGGVVRKSRYRLNANAMIAHTDAQTFVPGVHRGRIDAAIHEPEDDSITSGPNPTEKEIARLRLVEDPEGTSSVRSRRKLFNRKNNQVSRVTRTVLAEITGADSGVDFWWEVEQTSATEEGRKVLINEIVHSFLPAVSSTDTVVLDALKSEAYVESATATSFPFLVENSLPFAPPGDSLWVFLFYGLPTDEGFEEIHPEGNSPLSGPAGVATTALGADVAVDVVPRVTH